MNTGFQRRFRSAAKTDIIRFVDSYASLLVLLLANFFLLEWSTIDAGARSGAPFCPRSR
jgi:hypothetical protein